MLNNQDSYYYQLAVQQQIYEICQPLKDLNIRSFLYGKVYRTGYSLLLTNNLNAYLEARLEFTHCYGSIFKKQILSLKEKEHQSHFVPLSYNPADLKEDVALSLVYNYGINNAYYILQGTDPEYIEFFHYVSDKNNHLFQDFCLHHHHLLDQFCHHFQYKAKDIIEGVNKKQLALITQKLDFYQASTTDSNHGENFLHKLHLAKQQDFITPPYIFTPRELECIKYLAQGLSSKEIAEILSLTPRAVDFHIQNLKQKYNMNRLELVAYAVKHRLIIL